MGDPFLVGAESEAIPVDEGIEDAFAVGGLVADEGEAVGEGGLGAFVDVEMFVFPKSREGVD